MAGYPITGGRIAAPVKVVLYGPEGIGKTTLAAAFPGALFIDTEGGTKRLDVARLPRPVSWEMLLDEVDGARRGEYGCGTLVLDTADWAERLCVRAVCERARVHGIEDFGYGKGYVYLKEEFEKLLQALEDVTFAGCNVVVTAHAQITKFEQPDEMGSYDRWTMKTSKQVAPLLREWCDALLFANYKTIVVKDGDGKAAKGKAQGGRRVLYTAHHPCWDAKNRFGLPDEVPMEFAAIAGIVADAAAQTVTQAAPVVQPVATAAAPVPAPVLASAVPVSAAAPAVTQPSDVPAAHAGPRSVDALPVVSAAPAPTHPPMGAPTQNASASVPASEPTAAPEPPAEPVAQAKDTPQIAPALGQQLLPPAPSAAHAELYARMRTADIDDAELRRVVHGGGYYPEDMPVADYPAKFVAGRLLANWDGVVQAVIDSRDVPF